MAHNGTRNNLWFGQGTLAKNKIMQKMQISRDFIENLKQEASLARFTDCVGSLAWNERGNLIASAKDDRQVVVWDVFKREYSVVEVENHELITSVKFMPQSDHIVSAGDQLLLTDRLTNETLFACRSCQCEHVSSVAVHPNEPHLIWSASHRGLISQYDIREPHVCRYPKPPNLIANIKRVKKGVRTRCMVVNPARSELLAVGCSDACTRLLDRRAMRASDRIDGKSQQLCVAHFIPGHIHRKGLIRDLDGTSSLAFSSDGSELLASIHDEHTYLFNTYEPWQKSRSFAVSTSDDAEPKLKTSSPLKRKPHPHSYECSEQASDIELPEELKQFYDGLLHNRTTTMEPISAVIKINELRGKVENSAQLHRIRALNLLKRGWLGDAYQALRDCCFALLLNPLDHETVLCITKSLIRIKDIKDARRWLEFVEVAIKKFGNHDKLLKSKEMLLTVRKRDPNRWDAAVDLGVKVNEKAPWIQQAFAYLPDYIFLNHLRKYLVRKPSNEEEQRCANLFDYSSRYCGHQNTSSYREVNFFGGKDEFIVSGGDDGAIYIYDKSTAKIIKAFLGDMRGLDCVQPHPNICMLATCGGEKDIKLWSPNGRVKRDVVDLEARCEERQMQLNFIYNTLI